ncbi:DUF5719 family protein [Naasia aerilata]|uniref:Large extracellular alpha-helical protein n=1 Tax=Naasia aerilata TaxID=1162966 RepID=A0ABM8GCK5_9MICO|nr:DUF5719 family protein [Naasia aerilata]BDZ45981.1 hypothetical protein GCM10025866_18900 [Naasia aerilata]
MASDRRAALRIGGRVLTGVVAVGGAAALVLGASALPSPALSIAGAPVDPVAVDQHRVCPGPLLQLGDASGQGATTLFSYGNPNLAAGTLTGGGAAFTALADVDLAYAVDGGASALLSAPSAADPAALLAAAQVQSVSSGDAAGLAAVPCGEGAASSWLLAGATDTGRSSLLLLANANAVPATVDLSLYTAEGPIQAPGLGDLVVPAMSQRVLSLAGYAPGASQLAVEVRSQGGLVSAALQQTIVRGLEPGGVDVVGRTAPPATEQVLPGIRITTADAVAARGQVGGSQDVETVLRLLAPAADSIATVGVIPETEGGQGTSLEVELHAGEVKDVPLGQLAEGSYTVTVTTTEPVVATVRASTVAPPDPDAEDEEESEDSTTLDGGGDGEIGYDIVGPAVSDSPVAAGERIDLAWFTAGGVITTPTAFATVWADSPRLDVTNLGDAAVTVTLQGAGGEQKLEIPARATVGTDVAPNAIYVLTGTGPVAASVSYAGVGVLAAYPVRPANGLATPLTIYR